jgi:hypothetical protein
LCPLYRGHRLPRGLLRPRALACARRLWTAAARARQHSPVVGSGNNEIWYMMWSVHSRSEFRLPQRAGRHSKQRIINGQPRLLSQIVQLLSHISRFRVRAPFPFIGGMHIRQSLPSSHNAVIVNQPTTDSPIRSKTRFKKCTDSPPPGPPSKPLDSNTSRFRVRVPSPLIGGMRIRQSLPDHTMPSSSSSINQPLIHQSDPKQAPKMHRQSPPVQTPVFKHQPLSGPGSVPPHRQMHIRQSLPDHTMTSS